MKFLKMNKNELNTFKRSLKVERKIIPTPPKKETIPRFTS